MNRFTIANLTLGIALVLIAASTRAQSTPQPTVVVGAVEESVKSRPIQVNGVVFSRQDVLLSSTIEGEVTWMLDEGTRFVAGAVVARMDDQALQLQRAEQALLAQRAQANLSYLESEVSRLASLADAHLAARTQLAELTSRRDLARNELHVAAAQIDQIEDRIRRTHIIAPVDGVVVRRFRDVNEYARQGEPLLRVVNPNDLQVRASVPMGQYNRIDHNTPLIITSGRHNFEAWLRTAIPSGSSDSQTFDVLIDVPGADAGIIIDGQFVQVALPVQDSASQIYVPRDAVVLRDDGSFVFQIGIDNVVRRIAVTLGQGKVTESPSSEN